VGQLGGVGLVSQPVRAARERVKRIGMTAGARRMRGNLLQESVDFLLRRSDRHGLFKSAA